MSASKSRMAVFVVAAAAIASPLLACEPVMPFIQVVAPTLALSGSLLTLCVAVLLKSVLFAVFEERLPVGRSSVFMFVGNILTSIIGFVAAAMIGASGVWFIGVPVVFFLAWLPARRLVQVAPQAWIRRMSPAGVAALLTAALCLSCIFFFVGQAAILVNRLVVYWLIKLVAVYVALVASIALTATWEEWTIWRLAAAPTETSYFRSVIRSNIYVLLFIMAVGAILMFPKRLKSPDFLTKRPEVKVAQAVAPSNAD